jgi:transposase
VAFLVTKRISGRTYYYLRRNEWVDGRSRPAWEMYVGTLSDLSKLLRPPDAGVDRSPALQAEVRDFGTVATLWDWAERLGVREIIDAHTKPVPAGLTVGQYMVLAAINRCVDPCSKRAIPEWYEQTALRRLLPARRSQLSSQRFWDAMGQLDEGTLREIGREIGRRLIERFGTSTECLAYDATNFFTYIDSRTPSQLPQRGHNKERRIDLRQVSLALLVSREFHIPLLHEAYPGNRPDAPEFGQVVEELVRRQQELSHECREITLVFDKGNNSKENLQKLGSFHFVGSLVPKHHKELLAVKREQMVPLQAPGLEGLTAYRCEKEVFGRSVAVVMTFNPELWEAQVRGLTQHMKKAERRLGEIQQVLARWERGEGKGRRPTAEGTARQVARALHAQHLKRTYDVQIDKVPTGVHLTWGQNEGTLNELKEHLFGRTLIFTDQKGWSSEQIVLAYRGQYQIEQAFHWMKAPEIARWWPMHHWTDQKIRVHAFYCVLALTLLSLLRREMVRAGYDWSIEKILHVLENIREVELVGRASTGSVALTRMKREARAAYELLKLQRYRTI